MKKDKKFFKHLPNISKIISNLFKSRSISTQLIITIILVFSSFFILQSLLNSQFFKNYYTEREFDDIHIDLMSYVNNMNEPTNSYYDEMYTFTSQRNAYSVVVNSEFEILTSSYTDYTIVVEDNSSGTFYEVIVPDNDYTYTIDETISLVIRLYNENDNLYSPTTINTSLGTIYNSNISCTTVDCTPFTGVVRQIKKPNNLNYMFKENTIVKQEVSKLSSELIVLSDIEYMDDGYWYKSTGGPVDTLVFIHNLKWNTDFVITIIPIEDTDDITSILSSYNY